MNSPLMLQNISHSVILRKHLARKITTFIRIRALAPLVAVIMMLLVPGPVRAQTKTLSNPAIDSTVHRLAPSLKEQTKHLKLSKSAEVLYMLNETELHSDNTWEERTYVSIRVNDSKAARDYGRIAIRYNHYYSDLKLEFANTLSASGNLHSLSQDALQRRIIGGGQDFYSDRSELVFSLPDISPGSILEFQYIRQSKVLSFPELFSTHERPFWFQSFVNGDGWRADFVHNYHYKLTVPAAKKIHVKSYSGFDQQASITRTSNKKTYQWNMKKVPELVSETYLPTFRDFVPTLTLSTSKKWRDIDAWSWEKIVDKLDNKDGHLDAIIETFKLDTNASNEDKVRAVYAYIQENIRYVFAHLGRGGYEPHYPHEVLKVNYGDCKDQSVLAVALLRALGVQAYPALVETPSAGDSDTELVALIYDHMIVYIPPRQGVSKQWLDTTGDRSLYPGMSNYLKGQNAFIVNGQGGKLTHIPDLGQNKAVLTLAYTANDDHSYEVDTQIELEGFLEQNIRTWWVQRNDKNNTLKQYLDNIFSVSNEQTGNVQNAENIWQPTRLTAKFHFDKQDEDHVSYKTSIFQALRLFGNLSNLPLPESRKKRFYDHYDYELELNATFRGPRNTLPTLLLSNENHENPYFHIRNTYQRTENTATLKIIFKRKPLDLSVHEYAKYYADVQKLGKETNWYVKMLDDPSVKQQITVAGGTKEDVSQLILLARSFIEQGEFEKSLSPAHKAVKLSSNNGEAWYVLAMAQGFNSLIEESSASFTKAESLGYLP